MTLEDIAELRLQNHRIVGASFEKPADVVSHLVAMQAQDYLGALWSVGMRTTHATEKDIEHAISKREIVRTWPMRGTLHFVFPKDIKWMVELLAPRILNRIEYRHRQLELNDKIFEKCRTAVIKALKGGKVLTRPQMYQVLEHINVSTKGQRGIHILAQFSQEGLLCFGPRQDKQPTFVLLSEWLPNAKSKKKDEALAELTLRYFNGHGPATVQDYMWWSGLSGKEANAGIEMVKSKLTSETVEGTRYWLGRNLKPLKKSNGSIELLPGFDEYLLGYKDRSAVLETAHKQRVNPGNNGMFSPTILVNGQIVGTWKRTIKKSEVVILTTPFSHKTKIDQKGLEEAARRYGTFLGMDASLE